MSDLVVVAGATGYAGRYLVRELAEGGYRVRAIVRSRARAEAPGPHGSPSLAGAVTQWREGNITDPAFVERVCEGSRFVVSALGVTRQRASPWDVDYRANLRLLEDAEREHVHSFLYINVMHAEIGESLILRSKAAFTQALLRSSVGHQVINPSGYFSDVSDFLAMARHGVILLPPSRGVRVAPIHGADLARFSIDHLDGDSGSWDVGGPDVLTYEEMGHIAATAAGRRCRFVTIPKVAITATVWGAKRIGGQAAVLAEFFAEGLTHDAIGHQYGEHHLADFFRASS